MEIAGTVLTILAALLPYVLEALGNRAKRRPLEKFNKALAKNDFGYLTGDLSTAFDELPGDSNSPGR